MRYFNYVVIVVILVVSALLGRGYLQGGGDPLPGLQADLGRCLDAFWQTQGSQVEVLGTPAQAEVRASVAFPPDTGARQQQWMHPFLTFVAGRHAGVKLASVRVVPLASEQKKRLADSSDRPAVLGDSARAEAVQSDLQGKLDATLGAGKALILVDAASSSALSASFESAPEVQRNEAAPSMEAALTAGRRRGPDQAPPAPLHGCLVLLAQSEQAAGLVRPSLGQLRVMVLPGI